MGDLERTTHVLEVVSREMLAYAWAWRDDWSDFDGRTLRNQLQDLDTWAGKALRDDTLPDYTGGTEFGKEHGSCRNLNDIVGVKG